MIKYDYYYSLLYYRIDEHSHMMLYYRIDEHSHMIHNPVLY